jgi:hypothetical protein
LEDAAWLTKRTLPSAATKRRLKPVPFGGSGQIQHIVLLVIGDLPGIRPDGELARTQDRTRGCRLPEINLSVQRSSAVMVVRLPAAQPAAA